MITNDTPHVCTQSCAPEPINICNKIPDSIIAGLASGLLVTVLVVLFRAFWIKVINPWFENRVYKDIRIEGKWFALYPGDVNSRQELVVLKRHGHAITGSMICTNGADEGEEYKISGSFRNLLLPLTYESTDKSKSDRGTITLKCIRNGERFSGKIAAYDTADDNIFAANILWFRSKKSLEETINKLKKNDDRMKELIREKKRLSKEEAKLETLDEADVIVEEAVTDK